MARRHSRLLALLTGAVIAVVGGTACCAQAALTTREMRALPRRDVNKTVQEDILSILDPVHQITPGMFRRLRGVELHTQPFGTPFDGLCRRDSVWLRYAPVDTGPRPEDQPLRPYGIEATQEFHITSPLKPPRPDDDDAARVFGADCGRLGDEANWFTAPSALDVAQAVSLAHAAIEQLKVGRLAAAPCNTPVKGETCTAFVLGAVDFAKLNGIDRCPAASGLVCYALSFEHSHALTIVGRAADKGTLPTMVESIGIETYVIVT